MKSSILLLDPARLYFAWCVVQDFKGAAALSAEAKALAGQADVAAAKATKLRQQVCVLPKKQAVLHASPCAVAVR